MQSCNMMCSRVMHLVMSVCVCMYNYYVDRLFSALPLANILLSVICCLLFEFKHLQCGLLCPVSCTDRTIHAFPNKMQRPPDLEYFLLSFNCTSHSLGYYSWSLELTAVVPVVCFSECFSSCATTATIRCYNLHLYAATFQAQPPTMY